MDVNLKHANLKQCHTVECVFHFIEVGELRYISVLIHHTTDTCSEFQWASALTSEGMILRLHLLEMMAILENIKK